MSNTWLLHGCYTRDLIHTHPNSYPYFITVIFMF